MELNGTQVTSVREISQAGVPDQRRLDPQEANRIANRTRRIIARASKYDLSNPEEYELHCRLFKDMADSYTRREGRRFVIDENNSKVLRFLLYYFNNCPLAEEVFPGENYSLRKNILLCGKPGTGKTLMMQVFANYLRETGQPAAFRNMSVTELLNYRKVNGHIDFYTFNTLRAENRQNDLVMDGGAPFNVCVNDLGITTEQQKSYGTELTSVIDEFLFARYEIYQQWGIRYHVTSNMSAKIIMSRFESRIADRFKCFNVIPLGGESRR